ncbi:hypothetical protein BaRGS_00026872 [Batillaria attramentaria]|uniref:Uncharacterized protein n=1 Tax=Batillaria attramentaria TaxID=370345 RepID=A0ABD0K4U4_9CAEN
MPLSDFGFNTNNSSAAPQEQLIFNGFGSAKRKFTWDAQSEQEGSVSATQDECPAKRLCNETHVQMANSGFMVPQPVQPNSMQCAQLSSSSQAPMQQQIEAPSVFGCMKDVAAPVTHSFQGDLADPSGFTSQSSESDMVMDLCDETYSSPTHGADLESACHTMDSDFVPDPQQYEPDTAASGGSQMNASVSPKIVYCSTPCRGAVRSPSSNRLHCICRPWMDTILGIPYDSDYY